jgi:hypothetical protein
VGRIGIVAVLLGTLTLGLAACQQQEPASGKAAAQAPLCRSDDLALKRVSEDAPTSTVTYRFENRGQTLCALKGHPGIALTGPDGAALELKTINFEPPPGAQGRPLKVVLRPGNSASFNVVFPKNAGKGVCKPYVKLTATPPGSDWGLDVAQDAQLCDGDMLISTFWFDADAS